jgi:hypothetical protein
MVERVGLIAGSGRLPLEVARAAREAGHEVVAVAIRDLADAGLEPAVAACHWLSLGELGELLRTFRAAGVRRCVMAGKVPKSFLYERGRALRPDAHAQSLLRGLVDRRDDSILSAIADRLAAEGFELLPQAELTPQLLAPEGPLGRLRPLPEHWEEIRFAWPVARALGRLDVGQTVVAHGRAVMALEAIEGTDEAIRRGAALGGPGVCVVKVSKPGQDPRFDLPAVGRATLETLVEVKAAVLAVEAGHTLVLGREELAALADAARIPVVGVPPAGPEEGWS